MLNKLKDYSRKAFALVTAIAMGTVAMAGSGSEDNLLKDYYPKGEMDEKPQKIMIYDLNDNLLWSESINQKNSGKTRQLIRLLDKSDYLFNLDDTTYYIKTEK